MKKAQKPFQIIKRVKTDNAGSQKYNPILYSSLNKLSYFKYWLFCALPFFYTSFKKNITSIQYVKELYNYLKYTLNLCYYIKMIYPKGELEWLMLS